MIRVTTNLTVLFFQSVFIVKRHGKKKKKTSFRREADQSWLTKARWKNCCFCLVFFKWFIYWKTFWVASLCVLKHQWVILMLIISTVKIKYCDCLWTLWNNLGHPNHKSLAPQLEKKKKTSNSRLLLSGNHLNKWHKRQKQRHERCCESWYSLFDHWLNN